MEGQWQEGLTLLSGVQLPPGREAALPFLKGRYLLEAGQWQAAAGILEEGLKLHPSHVEMTLNLSTAYERLGRREDAVRMMERAVQLDPGNASYLNGLGYLLIDGQQLGKPAQILAAIIVFAILGKLTDWLIQLIAAPFLRWQDSFSAHAGAA